MTPASAPLTLWRNAPFREEWRFDDSLYPFDFTGWSAALQVRQYGGAGGAANVDLATVTADEEGVRILADAPGTVRVMIDQATAAAVPPAGEAGASATFEYDLIMIDPSGFRQIFRQGPVIVKPGVTV